MGTTALFGFYCLGKFYVVHSCCDSSPDDLGRKIATEVTEAMHSGAVDAWRKQLKDGELVVKDGQDESYPSNLKEMLAWGEIVGHVDEKGTPLWEQHGYVVNFDLDTLDRYAGKRVIQRTPLYQVDEHVYDSYDPEQESKLQMAHWGDMFLMGTKQ
ncbi:hypothetical protein QKT49_gp004 [Acanthamoeba castellanii medusavirus]|uniref:Uncharacterized protein n=1 Tax=Acanthamoeba castellanii medusavirus J1 TaxID=3114988 RepID=A0A3T1CWE0_9VIRU|nr:hypothetical protein QKT49_gp004 [Acanthamoeba castellanii medusavirus]BBI30144.1 hypothetical protein [Acanthamoeba castellanii medusavirus J1]